MSRLLPALAAIAATLALAACGSSDPTGTDAGSTASGGTFPATVTHAFGSTTVAAAPRRIVVLGPTEQDTVLALGLTPLATSEWYGEQPDAVWPWAQDELGDATPTVLPTTDGLAFERIAALRPDLILATNAGLARADYDKLRRIAPTVAQPRGGTRFLSPWDVQTELIAAALGRARQGRELVASIERDYAAVAREHPEFAGKTITFTQNGFYQGQLYAYPEGLNTQPLSLLGFTVNPRLTPLATERGVQVGVSAERLDVLDADVLVAATERAADVRKLLEVPTFRGLRAVRDRHAVYTDRILAGALYYPTPLSLPYLLERLVPRLERAVAGTAPQRIG